jgi:hypothetical protein
VDSTGLKIYGEGEWKVRQHGVSKRRTWRKLHIGANPEDGEIQAALLTENSVSDDEAVEALLSHIDQEIVKFAADGAYDKRKIYDGVNEHLGSSSSLIPKPSVRLIGSEPSTLVTYTFLKRPAVPSVAA